MVKLQWVRVRGYQRQVSAVVAANTPVTAPVQIFPASGLEVPSMNLITRITHIGTYSESLAAFSFCTWRTPWFPYNAMKDPMGQQGAPQELSDKPEISPGNGYALSGDNSDAVQHTLGFNIRGEQGYYREVAE